MFTIQPETSFPPLHELTKKLQSSDDRQKIDALQQMLQNYSAEQLEGVVMHIIKFATATGRDHKLIRLVHLFWEKVGTPENLIVLVCQLVRNELTSPNEYIRGACLRNMIHFATPEVVKTVEQCIIENIQHYSPYVRKATCFCIQTLVEKLGADVFDGDISEFLLDMAENDDDLAVQRHALLALMSLDAQQCVEYYIFGDGAKEIHGGQVKDITLISVIKSMYTKIRQYPAQLPKEYVVNDIVYELTPTVLCQRLMTILSDGASKAPATLLEAANAMIEIASSVYDKELNQKYTEAAFNAIIANVIRNITVPEVKVVVLRQLQSLILNNERYVVYLRKSSASVDLLSQMSHLTRGSLQIEAVKLILDIAVKCIDHHTVDEGFSLIESYISNTKLDSINANVDPVMTQIRECLFDYVKKLIVRFNRPDIIFYLNRLDSTTISLAKTAIQIADSAQRQMIVKELLAKVDFVDDPLVLSDAFHILGECIVGDSLRSEFIETIYATLSPFKFIRSSQNGNDDDSRSHILTKTVVLADGSYGMEISEKTSGLLTSTLVGSSTTNLRTTICMSITKQMLKHQYAEPALMNKALAIVGAICSLCKHGQSSSVGTTRVINCLKLLYEFAASGGYAENQKPHPNLVSHCVLPDTSEDAELFHSSPPVDVGVMDSTGCQVSSVFDTVGFAPNASVSVKTRGDSVSDALYGVSKTHDKSTEIISRNAGVCGVSPADVLLPWSGVSDPVFVEVRTYMVHMDVHLEIHCTNRTLDKMDEITVSIQRHGDMKLLLAPQTLQLSPMGRPGETKVTTAILRMTASESGGIFGIVSWTKLGERGYFSLAELSLDMLSCTARSIISPNTFRKLWEEFEWENKIPFEITVSSESSIMLLLRMILEATTAQLICDIDPRSVVNVSASPTNKPSISLDDETLSNGEYIKAVLSNPDLHMMAESGVFVINLATETVFGEKALINLSFEMTDDNLCGAARIRSPTQGIALTLGDRIAVTQRAFAVKI